MILSFLVCPLIFFLFFFFSSRRRHTRLQGDWSSDVCSSDLTPNTSFLPATPEKSRPGIWGKETFAPYCPERIFQRSEERRVGKSVDLVGRRMMKKKKKETKAKKRKNRK